MVPVLCKVVPLLQVDSSIVADGGSSIARSSTMPTVTFIGQAPHLVGNVPGSKCTDKEQRQTLTSLATLLASTLLLHVVLAIIVPKR